jgi:hypothetical protein
MSFPIAPPPREQEQSTMAIVSLVAGIGAWFVLPLVAAVVAIVCGHIARGQIRRGEARKSDDTMAVIGMVLGYSNLVLSCIGFAIAFLIIVGAIGTAAVTR